MDTFRALVAKGEKSERTLEVTQWIIRLNPGHYSVWCVSSSPSSSQAMSRAPY